MLTEIGFVVDGICLIGRRGSRGYRLPPDSRGIDLCHRAADAGCDIYNLKSGPGAMSDGAQYHLDLLTGGAPGHDQWYETPYGW
jgi:hypothetical protein